MFYVYYYIFISFFHLITLHKKIKVTFKKLNKYIQDFLSDFFLRSSCLEYYKNYPNTKMPKCL